MHPCNCGVTLPDPGVAAVLCPSGGCDWSSLFPPGFDDTQLWGGTATDALCSVWADALVHFRCVCKEGELAGEQGATGRVGPSGGGGAGNGGTSAPPSAPGSPFISR